ncbi:adenylate/guanylate cyclase domain-containing protein [Candidatus Albibeggiatoa sp. nov. NOAA]|uniref:adenylate/guanylate cyclase domain-containing protein n=1 Tax=Candidatus Albibeggiatoa sp. nov. NOAA TaxID=3162724 RepID=UPI0032FE6AD3|nr:PAS domain S-box protein [Thiotrichaceae bacterium]
MFYILLLLTGLSLGFAGYQFYQNQRLRQQLQQTATEYQTLHTRILNLDILIESMPVGITVFKPDGSIFCRNQYARQLIYSDQETDEQQYEVCAVDTGLPYPAEKTPFHRALKGKQTFIDDAEIKVCNRSTPVEMWGAPVYDKQGQLIFVTTLFQDIGQRLKLEQIRDQKMRQLLGEKERFRTIAETMPIPLFIISLSDGLILYANPHAAESFGLPLPKLIGTQMDDLYYHFSERHVFLGKLLKEKQIRGYELEYIRANGSPFWALVYSKIMLYNHEQVILTSMLDITERKKVEQERIRFTEELCDLNQAYQRFVPQELLNLLDKSQITDIQLGDHVEKEMTILFADIRDFTRLSEQMTPQENFNFINAYLSAMEPAIREHGGFIDKYVGDAIMALFPRGADDAVKSALAMLDTLIDFNQQDCQQVKKEPVRIGIGINTGKLMLGTIGGEKRMDGTVIADAVNLASRVESLTKNYTTDLLITHNTYLQLQEKSRYHIKKVDAVKVKGKSELVTVYAVAACQTYANRPQKPIDAKNT